MTYRYRPAFAMINVGDHESTNASPIDRGYVMNGVHRQLRSHIAVAKVIPSGGVPFIGLPCCVRLRPSHAPFRDNGLPLLPAACLGKPVRPAAAPYVCGGAMLT